MVDKSARIMEEQLKLIRTNIDFSMFHQRKKVLLVTSPETESGKSTISIQLAKVFAERGEKVLLIDADLRRPALHRYLGKNLYMGLTNIISGELSWQDAKQTCQLEQHTFSLLTSGPVPPNANELLGSQIFKMLIETIRDKFDRIIIDTPPVTVVADALVFSEVVDGAILVCRYQKTSKEHARQAVKQLKLAQMEIVGGILNGIKNKQDHQYYY
ncbi:CpsD/CapB family tyrosine-protein kinase [Listeria ilorinensis]|uniref:CpsD/CapB family tyrosine-protein kinase n=1 Tax=Listeria ilorinensis TaxID=2867439 RepID=UPI001EF57CDC|nr:CpsD/CapB family tyrosine-protein kinase [Listeria ilorinensis]